MENLKYFGVLKGFDFEKINKNNFQLLIDKNLFDVHELSSSYKHQEDYFGLELETIDWVFSNFFLFNRKEYHLKKELYNELYLNDRNRIEDNSYIEEDAISEIDYELEKEFDNQKKTIILEHFYKKYFLGIKDRELYLLYKNNTRLYGYNHFSDYYRANIDADEDYSCIVEYLQGKETYYRKQLKEVWELMFLVSKVCDFCIYKKQQIENPTSEIKTTTMDRVDFPETVVKNDYELIFKSDGYDIFKFIISKYTQEKNRAFFSSLYSFLLKKDKIIKKTHDSKSYRNFVNDHFGLKMSKIIQISANNPTTENERYEVFANYMKTYSAN